MNAISFDKEAACIKAIKNAGFCSDATALKILNAIYDVLRDDKPEPRSIAIDQALRNARMSGTGYVQILYGAGVEHWSVIPPERIAINLDKMVDDTAKRASNIIPSVEEQREYAKLLTFDHRVKTYRTDHECGIEEAKRAVRLEMLRERLDNLPVIDDTHRWLGDLLDLIQ